MSRIPLCIPDVGDSELINLTECIKTGMVSYAGGFVSEFERLVAASAQAEHAVATSAGTTALHVGLYALGVRPGDLVVIPTLTFIATANAVAHCGAMPWLFDCDPSSWMLDTALLAQSLAAECSLEGPGRVIHTSTGKRVAAIVPVHMLGTVADLDEMCDLADEWGLPVLADGAAALGSRYKGRGIGAGGAQLTAISFNANKIITSGGGGMLVGNDEALMARLQHITTTARDKSKGYHHDEVGFNYRMTNLQAAVGVAQMERLPDFVASKQSIAARYQAAFADIPDVGTFPTVPWSESNHWLSGIFVERGTVEDVSALREHLNMNGIDVPPFWKPMHLQPPYADAMRSLTGTADGLWERIVTLPCSFSLRSEQQGRVIEAVRSFFGRR